MRVCRTHPIHLFIYFSRSQAKRGGISCTFGGSMTMTMIPYISNDRIKIWYERILNQLIYSLVYLKTSQGKTRSIHILSRIMWQWLDQHHKERYTVGEVCRCYNIPSDNYAKCHNRYHDQNCPFIICWTWEHSIANQQQLLWTFLLWSQLESLNRNWCINRFVKLVEET